MNDKVELLLRQHGFDERMIQEILLAKEYTRNFRHGTPGHLSYLVIAMLFDIIEGTVGEETILLRRGGFDAGVNRES